MHNQGWDSYFVRGTKTMANTFKGLNYNSKMGLIMKKDHRRHNSSSPKENPTSRKKHFSRRADVIVFMLSLALIIPLILVSGTVIYFQTHQLNLPGVSVFDQDVSLMSLEETTSLVDRAWNIEREIILINPDDQALAYTFSPAEMGFWVDPAATASAAFQIGRDAYPFYEINLSLKGEPHLILPFLYFNAITARGTLESAQEDLTILPKDAALDYQDGSWAVHPAAMGRTLDIDRTLEYLMENTFSALLSQTAPLFVQTLPPAITDLSPVLGQIEDVVSKELNFKAYDPITDEHFAWQVPVDTKRSWVSVNPSTNEVQLEIDPEDLNLLIKTWEDSLGQGRSFENKPETEQIIKQWENDKVISATIQHGTTSYTVKAGESLWSISLKLGMPMWHILEENDGLTVNNVQTGMELTIPSKNILLPLPVIPEKRIVIDLSDQVMTVFENNQVRNTYIVSTGMSDSPTMAGIFQVQSHIINAYASNWDLWMPHFMGIYEAWPDFVNGIHGLPILSSGQRLWASALGTPASYGCIILDLEAAEDLYNWAEDGVVVEIRQ